MIVVRVINISQTISGLYRWDKPAAQAMISNTVWYTVKKPDTRLVNLQNYITCKHFKAISEEIGWKQHPSK